MVPQLVGWMTFTGKKEWQVEPEMTGFHLQLQPWLAGFPPKYGGFQVSVNILLD